MNTIPNARKTVADVIMEKLTEKKTEIQTQMSDDSRTLARSEFQIDERIVKMYSKIKLVLQKYRSGKLPKAFKILPSLNNWEHVRLDSVIYQRHLKIFFYSIDQFINLSRTYSNIYLIIKIY